MTPALFVPPPHYSVGLFPNPSYPKALIPQVKGEMSFG